MSLSTSTQEGPSYASVTAKQTLDPDMLESKQQLAELKMTIQAQQQQLQQTSAPQAPNPPAPSIPPELVTTIQDMMATIEQKSQSYEAYISQFPHHLPLERKYVQMHSPLSCISLRPP
jgi:hypothetical protein